MPAPFLVVNPKAYLSKDELNDLALGANQIAKERDLPIYFTAPFTALDALQRVTDSLIITAQHMDANQPGRGMGSVTAEALADIGVKATFLNHAEHPLTLSQITKTIARAHTHNIATIVCADSVDEAVAVATLNPTIVLAEPTSLIGTGQAPDDAYIKATVEQIRAVNQDVQVMIASGVSSAADVARVIRLGADGTGATSGIIKKSDPVDEIKQWVDALLDARSDRV